MPGRTTAGRLLVAAPPLDDPNFDRTVVLMLNHDDDGALGLVLNRPTDEAAVPGLAGWLERADQPAVVFAGGPVELHALIGLARMKGATPGDGWQPLSDVPGGAGTQATLADLGTVDLSADPDHLGDVVEAVRLFRGYAGWGSAQLEGELDVGAWIVVDPEASDVFTTDPGGLWRRVLVRQGGRLAWIGRLYPDDLESN
jgi:putative transcriptional regulator